MRWIFATRVLILRYRLAQGLDETRGAGSFLSGIGSISGRKSDRSTVLPAKVTEVSEGELTVVYELSGKTSEHWLTTRRWKKPG